MILRVCKRGVANPILLIFPKNSMKYKKNCSVFKGANGHLSVGLLQHSCLSTTVLNGSDVTSSEISSKNMVAL